MTTTFLPNFTPLAFHHLSPRRYAPYRVHRHQSSSYRPLFQNFDWQIKVTPQLWGVNNEGGVSNQTGTPPFCYGRCRGGREYRAGNEQGTAALRISRREKYVSIQ